MFKFTVNTILAACFMASLCFGQVATARANIPFDFIVGGKLLPAGQYLVKDYAGAVALSSERNGHTVMALSHAESRNSGGPAQLVFNRYGDANFLTKVYATNSTNGAALMQSKREKQIARLFKHHSTTPTVAALR